MKAYSVIITVKTHIILQSTTQQSSKSAEGSLQTPLTDYILMLFN